MKEEHKKMLGILVRSFAIAAISVFFAAGVDIWSVDAELAKAIVNAGVVAVVWTVFSWLKTSTTCFRTCQIVTVRATV